MAWLSNLSTASIVLFFCLLLLAIVIIFKLAILLVLVKIIKWMWFL
jgi:hypothetical protein